MALYELIITSIFTISAFIGVSLIFSGLKSHNRQELPGIALLILGASFGYVNLSSYGALIAFPHLIRALSPFMYLIGPLFFVYMLCVTRNSGKLQPRDSVHFLFFALHFLELLPFYLKDAETKRQLAEIIQTDINVLFRSGSGIIPITVHYFFRIFLLNAYAVWMWIVIRSKSVREDEKKYEHLKVIAMFFSGMTVLLTGIFLIGTSGFPKNLQSYGNLFLLNVLSLFLLFSFGFLIFSKHLTSFLNPRSSRPADEAENDEIDGNADVDPFEILSGFTDSDLETFRIRIRAALTKEAITNLDLKAADIAEKADIPKRIFSALLSSQFGCSFRHLLNTCRVEEAKRLIEENEDELHSMDGIGSMAGFASRSTFYRVFKEITGMTPKAYKEFLLNS